MLLCLRVSYPLYLTSHSDHGFDATTHQLTSRYRLSKFLLQYWIRNSLESVNIMLKFAEIGLIAAVFYYFLIIVFDFAFRILIWCNHPAINFKVYIKKLSSAYISQKLTLICQQSVKVWRNQHNSSTLLLCCCAVLLCSIHCYVFRIDCQC